LPYDVVFLLNRYFTVMGEAIEQAGGYLDKFIGDGIMAWFDLEGGREASSLAALKAARGAVVNIASISGLRASTLRVAYGTSKAAVIQLTKQQAAELGEWGVRANCVCPGPVRTKLAMAVHTQDIIDAYHDAIPLNRYGSEDEIAEAIAFLLSHRASYITGQVLAADGGFESTGVGLPALRS
ncbi:MAG: SDR family oxidoreductase, partial [Paracoccaceae bacterium]